VTNGRIHTPVYPLDFRDFGGWSDFIAEVKRRLISQHRSVLIQYFPNHESNHLLIKLAKSLGRPDTRDALRDHPLEDGMVFRVERRGEGIRDSRGVVLYSTTHAGFPSHTDGSGKPDPYDAVLLYCVRQDPSGGESFLITLDELVRHLDVKTIGVLRTTTFPVPFGLAPIVSGQGPDMWIRYNADELSLYAHLRRIEFTESQKNALADLAETVSMLERKEPTIRMSPGDCLVIDNKRALHGRSAFSADGGRLLKRIRLYWLEPQESVCN
jgi:Taurine catabolism dioxygenase TauD, TfdA family